MRRAVAVLVALALPLAAGLPARAAAPAGAGLRTLTYAGEKFEVPSSWAVDNLGASPSTCVRFDRHAVYEGRGGAAPDCPPTLAGVTEALQILPLDSLGVDQAGPDLRAATIGGQQAEVNTDQAVTQRLIAAFPAAGVLVTISYGNHEAVARRILASFVPAPVGSSAAGRAPAVSGPLVRAGTGDAVRARAAAAGSGTSASGAVFSGEGFDACGAPSGQTMSTWLADSPYRAVGVYVGGINRACADGYLSASWVAAEVAAGWHIFPLYVGRQASCADQGGLASITTSGGAALQGTQAAQDAVNQMAYFGMGPGSPIYFDMESWDTNASACSAAVVSFVEAWSEQLVAEGYVPGIYGSADGGIGEYIAPLDGQPGGPEVVDIADWDGYADTTVPGISAWPGAQRIKQYTGGTERTYGGATIDIDQDYADTPLVGGPGAPATPTVTSVRPAAAAVGTTVTVTGSNFAAGATAVHFGAFAAAGVTVTSPTTLTARVPAQPMTTLEVTATTPGGTSVKDGVDSFTYIPVVATESTGSAGAYRLAGSRGEVFSFDGPWYGSRAADPSPSPEVGIAADAATGGYWLVTATGHVDAFHAPNYGSAPAIDYPVVGIAADAATGGYRLVTSKGRVYSFHAPSDGWADGSTLPAPVVGIAADASTGGYRLVTSKGTVLTYDAAYRGGIDSNLTAPVVGIAADAATDGYWLVTSKGTVYAFSAPSDGSVLRSPSSTGVVSITAATAGYLIVTRGGDVFNFGTPWHGSRSAMG